MNTALIISELLRVIPVKKGKNNLIFMFNSLKIKLYFFM